MIGAFIIQIVLIAVNALFASSEIAVISMSEARLKILSEEGDKRAGRLLNLTRQPAKFLATIQVAITLAGLLGGAFAAENFADPIVDLILSLGVSAPRTALHSAVVFLITLVLTYFSIVFGELVPKRLAMKNPEGVSLKLAGMLYAISKVFKPIVSLLSVSVNAVLRLLGVDPNSEDDEYSEEEIRMMAIAGSQKGSIGEEENEFIQNLFEFDDQSAEHFCTHRTQMAVLWADEGTEEWEKEIFSSRHSFYPICQDTTDKIIGVLDIKDYFALPERSAQAALKECVKPAYFVPDSIKADVLLERMRRLKKKLAVVCDEYGGVTGIVTINDLIELLVGDLEGEDNSPQLKRPQGDITTDTES